MDHRYREQTDGFQREESWVKKGKGIKGKKKKPNADTDKSIVIDCQREEWWDWWKRAKGGSVVVRRDLTLGGKHRMQCADHAIWNCTLQTCMALLTTVAPQISIKKLTMTNLW